MNVNQIINLIREVAISQTMVNSVYDGDVYANWNKLDVKYGSVNVGLKEITYDIKRGQNIYSFILYYGDRLLSDNSNSNDIYTDGIRVLQSIINNLNNQSNLDVVIDMDNITYYPIYPYGFYQPNDDNTYQDLIAGVNVEIDVTVPSELDACTLDNYEYVSEKDKLIEHLYELLRAYRIRDAELAPVLQGIIKKVTGENAIVDIIIPPVNPNIGD